MFSNVYIQVVCCVPGTYQPATATNSCLPCPAGYYCIGNSSIPLECPPYSYCPEGSVQPILCPDGTYTPDDIVRYNSSDECADCVPGESLGWSPGKSCFVRLVLIYWLVSIVLTP